MRYPSR